MENITNKKNNKKQLDPKSTQRQCRELIFINVNLIILFLKVNLLYDAMLDSLLIIQLTVTSKVQIRKNKIGGI